MIYRMHSRKIHCILAIALLLAFIHLNPSYPQDHDAKAVSKKRLAVLEFSSNNTPDYFARIMRNTMEVSLYSAGEFQLLEWEQIQKVLMKKRERSGDAADVTGSVKLGEELGTDFLIAGSIDKIDEYRISARVVSVREKKILMAYSVTFRSAAQIDSIVEKMAQEMARDIRKYVETGELGRRFYDQYKIKIGIEFNYLQPLGRYNRLVNGGFGGSFESGIENVFIDNFYMGISIGYYRHSGRLNSDDRLTSIPVYVNTGYRIPLLRRVHLIPLISPGFAFITMKHGFGPGFSTQENTERSFVEPSIMAGLSLAVIPVQGFDIRFTARYGCIYETVGVIQFISMGIGTFFSF